MILKQNFTNLLVQEISKLEKQIDLIKKEKELRGGMFQVSFEDKDRLESILNKKAILTLENELISKESFLSELRDKHLVDCEELDNDYADLLNNKDRHIEKISEAKDPHDIARLSYLKEELKLWGEQEHKEACVFYYKALKYTLIDAGIIID